MSFYVNSKKAENIYFTIKTNKYHQKRGSCKQRMVSPAQPSPTIYASTKM